MYNNDTWLDKLERKIGRFSIKNLMTVIVAGMGLVFIFDLFLYPIMGYTLSSLLCFDRQAIFHGQVWRLFTFILIPPDSNPFFILFSLYFYWLIGSALEKEWGSFRFNVYYLCGIIGTIISGMIMGYATNSYLNLSLFLGFAIMYPDHEVLLFFFIPIKMKYLAIVDAACLTLMFIFDKWPGRVALLAALINIVIFFWRDFVTAIKNAKRLYEYKKNFRQ